MAGEDDPYAGNRQQSPKDFFSKGDDHWLAPFARRAIYQSGFPAVPPAFAAEGPESCQGRQSNPLTQSVHRPAPDAAAKRTRDLLCHNTKPRRASERAKVVSEKRG
jgi:hypothetical protein